MTSSAFEYVDGTTVLSMDPGATKVGYAVIHDSDPDSVIVNVGVLTDRSDKSLPYNVRLNEQVDQFTTEFTNIIEQYHVDRVVWEIVPSFGTGYGSQSRVLATATVLKVLTFQQGLPFMEMSPQRWHKMLLGKSKDVKKPEVIAEILKRYPYLDQLTPDEADAIGIGLMALDAKEDEWKHFARE